MINGMTAKVQLGQLITYTGCPISWALRVQTEVAVFTTENKHFSLSSALQEIIPMMSLVQEFKERYDNGVTVSMSTV